MKKKFLVVLAVVVVLLMLASPMAATASVQTVTRTTNLDTGWDQWLTPSPALIPCTSPPPGMVAWWPLDEPTGAIKIDDFAPPPSSIHNNAGMPQPGGSVGSPNGPNSVVGQVNSALTFSPGLFVEVPAQTEIDIGLKDLSIDAWVKPFAFLDAGGGPLLQPIVDKLAAPLPLPNPVTGTGYALYIFGNALHFVIGDSVLVTYTSLALIPSTLNTWTHVAVTVSRGTNTVTFYINGVQDTFRGLPPPPLPTGSIANSDDLWIGNGRLIPPGDSIEIAIDELEIFDREITLQEVENIFNAGPAGKCRGVTDRVGGTTSFLAGGSSTPVEKIAVLGGGAAGVLAILAWGGWYTRRRWLGNRP